MYKRIMFSNKLKGLMTALLYACERGHMEVVTFLVSQGASLSIQTNVSTRIVCIQTSYMPYVRYK